MRNETAGENPAAPWVRRDVMVGKEARLWEQRRRLDMRRQMNRWWDMMLAGRNRRERLTV